MYVPRQRGIQPASTNRSSHHSYSHGSDPKNGSRRKLDYTYTRYTTDLGARRGSIPRVGVKAATAVGQHPYPFRTRKLSPPAYRPVLEWETLWETRFAASTHCDLPHTAPAVWGFRIYGPPIGGHYRSGSGCAGSRPRGLCALDGYESETGWYWLVRCGSEPINRCPTEVLTRQGGRVRPNASACRAEPPPVQIRPLACCREQFVSDDNQTTDLNPISRAQRSEHV